MPENIEPELITLSHGGAAAAISATGAEPVAWSVGGRELMWEGDPTYWPRVSPVLFPIVGRARNSEIHVDGKAYPMGIHGFAPSSSFSASDMRADSVRLTLADSDNTHRHFPFAFKLEVLFRLGADCLAAEFALTNPGDVALPFSLGFHPGFRWPFAEAGRGGHAVIFEKSETPHVPVITKEGLFSSDRRAVALDGRRLPLTEETLAREALCFLDAASRSLAFTAPDGSAVTMAVENFPHLALWGRAGAGFVCMEAWTGHGDPDGFAGDLRDKPSMRLLAPGATSHHRVRMAYSAPTETP